jgi:hypothetical protein
MRYSDQRADAADAPGAWFHCPFALREIDPIAAVGEKMSQHDDQVDSISQALGFINWVESNRIRSLTVVGSY